jgi:histidinol-phosphate aminotransferase
MSNEINRRNWIKTSAMMAGGLAFLGGTADKLAAAPIIKKLNQGEEVLTEEMFLRGAPIDLKARLNANENPFGPSPAAKKALMEAIDGSFRYPMRSIGDLAEKIAKYEGVSPFNNVMLAAGSTPLLMAAAMHYSEGGKEIVTGDPSYEDLPSRAVKFGAKWIKVPLTPDYKLDLDAMEAKVNANTGLVYICNPNNPTATVVDTAKLKAFIDRVSKKTTVFVDEAYINYLPDPDAVTMIGCVKAGQNVIVARTFSKLYGFAGLRCGYIITQPEIIGTLSKYADGFGLAAPTIAAAMAAYQEKDFLQDALKKTMASKEYLYSVLKKEGYEYIPSSANFVMFPLKMDKKKFSDEMYKRGVGIRTWVLNGKDYCRISIGRMDEMEAFADAFKQIS